MAVKARTRPRQRGPSLSLSQARGEQRTTLTSMGRTKSSRRGEEARKKLQN